ncbi:MAG: hypothetical protein ACM3S2_00075 [Ignavibacteriales bacterium]
MYYILAYILVFLVWLIIEVVRAPWGVEDETGFHKVEEPVKEKVKVKVEVKAENY